jgi:uncharacterized protein YraI
MRALLLALLLTTAATPAHAQWATACTRDPNSGVNLRSGPGRNYGVIATIPNGSYLRALTWVWGGDGMRWWRVEAGGLVAWSRGDFLCRD